jgi:hypothetical protein
MAVVSSAGVAGISPLERLPYPVRITMTSDTILTRFADLNTWRQGDQRAPHK